LATIDQVNKGSKNEKPRQERFSNGDSGATRTLDQWLKSTQGIRESFEFDVL